MATDTERNQMAPAVAVNDFDVHRRMGPDSIHLPDGAAEPLTQTALLHTLGTGMADRQFWPNRTNSVWV